MKKCMMALLCIVMAGMVLSGCAARTASGTTATAAPIVTNSPMATAQPNRATVAPDMSPDMNAGAAAGAANAGNVNTGTAGTVNANAASMTPAQADRLAENIADAVERISEIDDAEVVIGNNSRVLVAVEFDDQYSAGLDERMKKMIVEAVQKEDASLKEIEITDDGTLYGQVKGLGERLANATGLDELADDFGDLWNRVTGL